MAWRDPGALKTVPLKAVTRLASGATPSKDRSDFWNGDVPWISPKDMKARWISDTIDHITESALQETRLSLLPRSTILMVVRGMILAHTVPVCMNDRPSTINQDIKGLILTRPISPEFLQYFLSASQPYLLSITEESGHGTKALRTDLLYASPVLMPSLSEQHAIAAFLDRKTARIDGLIAKKKRLIELLREKHQAVISHTVTKGLDPSAAPMKDSGIDWLGEIPAHWELLPLKRCLRGITQGWSPECETDWLSTRRVGRPEGWLRKSHGEFRAEQHKALPTDLQPRPALQVMPGDLLMSRANTTELVGHIAIVPEGVERLMLCDKLYRLDVFREATNPVFLSYALRSHSARRQLMSDATGASSSMQNIGQDTVRSCILPMPPEIEQRSIVERLDEDMDKIVSAIEPSESSSRKT